VGVACPAACEYMDKMTTSGEILAARSLCAATSGNPHLTSPGQGGGIAVLFRRHEAYADLRNLVLADLFANAEFAEDRVQQVFS
jgi:hypothetical protein